VDDSEFNLMVLERMILSIYTTNIELASNGEIALAYV
jgi:hypothetical protein